MASVPPPGVPQMEYGADEISALILDPGYSTVRAGFAGEDTPKAAIPSFYGSTSSKQYVFDDNSIHQPIAGFNIKNPMAADGTVEDWDAASKLWEYAITSRLTFPKPSNPLRNGLNDPPEDGDNDVNMEDVENNEKPLAENPLLLTEPTWNSTKNREKAIELALEDWGAPAFFLSKNAVMASFASGKSTALVVDIGASTTSVTPVHDGLVLKKSTVKSPLAGNWISEQILSLLAHHHTPPVNIVPYHKVVRKSAVDADQKANAVLRSFPEPLTETYERLQRERTILELKEYCVQVWNPLRNNGANLAQSADILKTEPVKPFEFPDGYNTAFGIDRYRVVEGLFDPQAALSDPSSSAEAPSKAQTIPGLLASALGSIDTDTKQNYLNNVVITGGSSLLVGMTDRINHELAALYPGPKIRIQAPGSVVERKYASWIGGSIVASLGAFHQMWISKKEYEESGANIVEKRCK